MPQEETVFDPTMGIPDPSKIASDTWSTIEGFFSHFTTVIDRLVANLSLENIIFQTGIMLISIALGYFLSKQVNRAVGRLEPKDGDRAVIGHLKHIFVSFVQNISFSFLAASVLAFGSFVMVQWLGFSANSLVIAKLTYSLFYAYALLSLLIAFLQGIMGRKLITPVLRRYVTVGFWILAFLQFFGVLGEIVSYLDNTVIPIGDGKMTVWMLFVAVMSVLLTLGVANWISSLAIQAIDNIETLSINIKVVLGRVVRVTFLVLAVIIGLGTVGVDLTILSVFGGAVGVGLGFGLQKIASNYISGFIILLDKSIKIGDLVTVGGFQGRVTAINTRFTVVRDNGGVENIVPNENFVTSAVLNHSYTDESTIQKIAFSVAYDADVKRALEIMMEEANRPRARIDTTKRGWAALEALGDPGIDLTLAYWVKDPVNGVGGLRTEITLAVLKRFDEENIEVPFNMLEINFRKNDAGPIPVKTLS